MKYFQLDMTMLTSLSITGLYFGKSENLRLNWFYQQVIADVTRFKVPTDIVIDDSQHKWGRSPFHYTAPVYDCLLSQH